MWFLYSIHPPLYWLSFAWSECLKDVFHGNFQQCYTLGKVYGGSIAFTVTALNSFVQGNIYERRWKHGIILLELKKKRSKIYHADLSLKSLDLQYTSFSHFSHDVTFHQQNTVRVCKLLDLLNEQNIIFNHLNCTDMYFFLNHILFLCWPFEIVFL